MNYSSPTFVNIVLIVIYVLLAAVVGLTVWSAVRTMRRRSSEDEGGIKQHRTALGLALGLASLMGVLWLTGSRKPLVINGKVYSDEFWLPVSDMMINTATFLLVVIVILMVYVGVMELKEKFNKKD
jgi:cytochrome bd-type quinol oxidase subunit 1